MSRAPRPKRWMYAPIPEDEVCPGHVPVALAVVEWAAKDLGIKPPPIVWFTRRQMVPQRRRRGLDLAAPEVILNVILNAGEIGDRSAEGHLIGNFNGLTGTVYLGAIRDTEEMVRTLLHEMRHAWQHATGAPEESNEDDAEDYARRAYSSVALLVRQAK